MAAENIFQQYLRPIRSVAEYSADMDEADGRRNQNALQRLQVQQQTQALTDAAESRSAYRGAFASSGGDRNALIRLLSANPLTAAQGATMQKADVDLDKTRADTEKDRATAQKTSYELRRQKADEALRDIAALQSPQEAVAGVQRHLAAGDIDQVKAQALIQSIGATPDFGAWKLGMLTNILSAKDQLDLSHRQAQLAETTANNARQDTTQRRGQDITRQNSVDTNATSRTTNAATVGATIRGQNLTDARARETNDIQKAAQRTQVVDTPNGPLLVDKGSGQGRPVSVDGKPVPGDTQMKRESGARRVLDLLDQAKTILPTATNSTVGAGIDAALQLGGMSNVGAQGTARLKAIEGALLSEMPRMEGPQSNYDVQNYKQAAANLGDPTVPRETKQAAIATIEQIQQRYAGGARPAQQAQGGSPARINGDAEYNALPSGATFIGPDGKTRRKP